MCRGKDLSMTTGKVAEYGTAGHHAKQNPTCSPCIEIKQLPLLCSTVRHYNTMETGGTK